jgi:hypothetical protein
MDYILFLQSIQRNLYRFGGAIFILSVIVFMKKNLRKSSCAIYFIALKFDNLLFISSSLLFHTLSIGYDINPTSYNLNICHYNIYGAFTFESFSSTYLPFASIDRILVASTNARIRRFSTRRLALISIISATLFWSYFHTHTLFLTSTQVLPNYFICYLQPDIYRVLVGYYALTKTNLMDHLWIMGCKEYSKYWSCSSSTGFFGIENNSCKQSQSYYTKRPTTCLNASDRYCHCHCI